MRLYGVPICGVLAGDHEVGAEREVAAAADAPAVHLGDHRLRRAPDAHELLRRRELRRGGEGEVLARVPAPVGGDRVVPVLEAVAEVVAGAERRGRRRGATMTLHLRVARSARPTAASTSSGIGGTIVFSRSGRFSVIVATGPSTE